MTLVVLTGAGACAIWATVAILVSLGHDRWFFEPNNSTLGRHGAALSVPVGRAEILIRRYGSADARRIAVFFPGAGGYSRFWIELSILLPLSREATVYAICYPGHGGARGRIATSKLVRALPRVMNAIREDSGRASVEMVYFGDCYGASVAMAAAKSDRSRGLVLNSVSVSEARFFRAWLRQRAYRTVLLPFAVFSRNFRSKEQFAALSEVPIVIFQGENDDMAPIAPLRKIIGATAKIVPVAHAGHFDFPWDAAQNYVRSVLEMFEGAPRPLSRDLPI